MGMGIASPHSAYNLLKTPGNADDDIDEKNTPWRSKLMKTPQYFSVGKRLFDEDASPSRKDLGEISSQLKNKLSLAFDTLQQKSKCDNSPVRMEHEHLASPKDSFTKNHELHGSASNINLFTLEQLPRRSSPPTSTGAVLSELQNLPIPKSDYSSFDIPSPDEESSAQSALLAAFVRAKERRLSHSGNRRRSSVGHALSEGLLPLPPGRHSHVYRNPHKLAPLQTTPAKERSGKSEQDAIYSLMSLSNAQKSSSESPQGLAFHGTLASLLRSSSIAMHSIPPISTLVNRDDDVTDIEDATASEDEANTH